MSAPQLQGPEIKQNPPKWGTYEAYKNCLLEELVPVLASSALKAAGAIALGKSLGNPVRPPAGFPLKAPKMLVSGQKWGPKSQII
jgi:hypothetical protein